jgi:hypothetical protein|tara:strand:+ start:814 stop:1065 length:252 start_codon:yes stop_codon:yes gene_type:complete
MNLNNLDPRLKAKLKIPFNKKEKVNNENIIKIMEENKKEMKILSDIVKQNKLEINNLKKENNDLKNQVHEILGIIQTLINLKD